MVIISCFCIFQASSLRSATFTWDGGGGDDNWSTPENWSGDEAPGGGQDVILVFAGTTRLNAVNDLPEDTEFEAIHFAADAGNFILSGNRVRLGNGGGGSVIIDALLGIAATHIRIDLPIHANEGIANFTCRTAFTFNGKLTGNVISNPELNFGFAQPSGGASLGRVRLTNPDNDFPHAAKVLVSGDLEVDAIADAGVPCPLGAGEFLMLGNAGGGVTNGELYYVGNGSETDRRILLGGGVNSVNWTAGGTIFNDGTGPLVFDNPQFLRPQENVLAPRVLALGGTFGGTNRIDGTLADNIGEGGTVGLRILGSTWRLLGEASHSGGTVVESGRLILDGDHSSATGDVTVESGATLAGVGTAGGDATVRGTLAPGGSSGTLTFAGDLLLESGSRTVIEIPNDTLYDRVDGGGAGTLAFADGAVLEFDFSGYSPAAGDVFAVFPNWADLDGGVGQPACTVVGLEDGYSLDTTNLFNDGTVRIQAVALSEGFDGTEFDDEWFQTSPGDWSVSGGAAVLSDASGLEQLYQYRDSRIFTDFRATMRFRITSGSGWAGIGFSKEEPDAATWGTGYNLLMSTAGTLTLNVRDNESGTGVKVAPDADTGVDPFADWVELSVEKLGSSIRVWVDGVLRIDASDDSWPSGYLSFNLYNLSGEIDFVSVVPLGDLPYERFGNLTWALDAHSDAPGEYPTIMAAHPVDFSPVRFLRLNFTTGIDWANPFWDADHSWLVLEAAALSHAEDLRLLVEDWEDSGGERFSALRAGRMFSIRHSGNEIRLDYTAPPTREIHVSKTGDDVNPGTEAEPCLTIDHAAQLAMPGDTVVVHAGTYRERVRPARGGFPGMPITYRAAEGEAVKIAGSNRYADWTQVSGDTWQRVFTEAEFNGYNPYALEMEGAWLDGERSGNVNRLRGEVYLDGQPLDEVHELADVQSTSGSWAASGDGLTVYANFGGADPNASVAEVVMREQVFAPEEWNLGFIHVRGFLIEHAANGLNDNDYSYQAPTRGAISPNGGHDWVIEGNTIQFTKSFGVELGLTGTENSTQAAGWNVTPARYGHHVFRDNTVRDIGTGGIHAFKGPFCTVENNRFIRCNRLVAGGSEKAAVKFVWFGNDLRIRGNYFYKNNLGGGFSAVWLDAGSQGARVTGNVFVDNDYVWFERQLGPLVFDNNVMINTNFRISDGGGVLMAHNLVVRTDVEDPENDYDKGGVGTSGNDIDNFNNLTRYDSYGYIEPAYFQPHTLNQWGDALTRKADLHWHNNIVAGDFDHYLPPEDENTYDNHSNYNVFLDGASPTLQDADSVVSAAPVGFAFTADEEGVEFSFDVPAAALGMQTPFLEHSWIGNLNRHVAQAIDPVSHDIHGVPVDTARPVPGPFATLVAGTRSYSFNWNAQDNSAPVFQESGVSVPSATEGAVYTGTLAGSSYDGDIGDTLVYAKLSGPDWLTVATDGTLSGVPASSDAGANVFTVEVRDTSGASDTATFTIEVGTPQTKPNIVVFLADDLGWTGMQYHPELFPQGSDYYETPNLATLAKSGVVFHNARSLPLCSPSRASLLGGQYAGRLDFSNASGVNDPDYVQDDTLPLQFPESVNHLYENITTLANYLGENHGYHNWHVGKWHIGSTPSHKSTAPVNRGFDRQFFLKAVLPHHFGPFDSSYGIEDVFYPDGSSAVGTTYDHNAEVLTKIATDLIEEHAAGPDADEPFYLNLWHYMIHSPFEARESDVAYFEARDPDGVRGHGNPYYAAMIRYLDDSLGELVRVLKETGEYNDTLFIFYSDNGGIDPLLGEFECLGYDPSTGVYTSAGELPMNDNWPLNESKVSIREGGTRVPAVVSYPASAMRRGVLVEEAVHLVDLFPTILDYLGEPGVRQIADRNGDAQPLDGESLRPLLEGSGAFPDRPVFTYWPRADWWAASIVRNDYKLIRWYVGGSDGSGRADLFHLASDVGESYNLAATMPELAFDMLEELDAWVQSTANHPPISNPDYDGVSMEQQAVGYYDWLFSMVPDATPEERHPYVDLDGDGKTNFVEFLRGCDPIMPETVDPIQAFRSGDDLEFRFQVPPGRDDTVHALMSTTGFSTWSPVPAEQIETVGANGFGDIQLGENQFYIHRQPLGSAPERRFYRLETSFSGELEIGRRSGYLADSFLYSETGSTIDSSRIAHARLETGAWRQVRSPDLASVLAGTRYTVAVDVSWEDPTNGDSTEQRIWGGVLPGAAGYQYTDSAFQFALNIDTGELEVGVGDGSGFTVLGTAPIPDAPPQGASPSRFYTVTFTIDETGASPRIESVVFDGQPVALTTDTIHTLSVDRTLVFNTTGGLSFLIDNLEIRSGGGTLVYRDNFNSPDSTYLNLD